MQSLLEFSIHGANLSLLKFSKQLEFSKHSIQQTTNYRTYSLDNYKNIAEQTEQLDTEEMRNIYAFCSVYHLIEVGETFTPLIVLHF
jgi:hypothetical protein